MNMYWSREFVEGFKYAFSGMTRRQIGSAALLATAAVGTVAAGYEITNNTELAHTIAGEIYDRTAGRMTPSLPKSVEYSTQTETVTHQAEAYRSSMPAVDGGFEFGDYPAKVGTLAGLFVVGSISVAVYRRRHQEQPVALGRMLAPVPDYLCELSLDEQKVIDDLELQFKQKD